MSGFFAFWSLFFPFFQAKKEIINTRINTTTVGTINERTNERTNASLSHLYLSNHSVTSLEQLFLHVKEPTFCSNPYGFANSLTLRRSASRRRTRRCFGETWTRQRSFLTQLVGFQAHTNGFCFLQLQFSTEFLFLIVVLHLGLTFTFTFAAVCYGGGITFPVFFARVRVLGIRFFQKLSLFQQANE